MGEEMGRWQGGGREEAKVFMLWLMYALAGREPGRWQERREVRWQGAGGQVAEER